MNRRTEDGVAPASAPAPDRAALLLRVAWLSVLLGLAVEAAVLVALAVGGELGGVRSMVADLVQKITWSVFVCVGLAFGRTAAQAIPVVTGAYGLLAAPLGFALAKGLQKGVAEALGLATDGGAGPSPLLIATLRGLEYALLGAVVGWLATKVWGGALAHLASGLVAGIVFGGAVLALTLAATPGLGGSALAARVLNEVLFPVGCAFVLFAGEALGRRLA